VEDGLKLLDLQEKIQKDAAPNQPTSDVPEQNF
jgi:hypothetical protein